MNSAIALLLYAVAGVIAGWLAGRVMKGYGFGLPGDAAVGVIGALASAYLFRATGAVLGGALTGNVLVAFGGALLFLFIVRLFIGRGAGRSSRA